jgi:hypothetical protein
VHQKYSTILFSQIIEIVAQPVNKTKFQLGFVTLLVGVFASSNTAISQTVGANRNEHRPLDRMLVSHASLCIQGLGSKKFNMPNGFIASSKRHDEHHDKTHSGKPTDSSGINVQGSLTMPKPHLNDGSGNRLQQIIMPKPRTDHSKDRQNPSKMAPRKDRQNPSKMAPKY